MDYKETLPAGCPPAAALPATDGQVVFRLVDANPATDNDFKSQRALRPHAKFIGVDECRSLGVSVHANRQDSLRARMLPALKGKKVCRLTLTLEAGPLLQTGKPSHHTWWPQLDFNILENCEVE